MMPTSDQVEQQVKLPHIVFQEANVIIIEENMYQNRTKTCTVYKLPKIVETFEISNSERPNTT